MSGAYFDHAATTPVDDRVLQAMLPYFGVRYANPSELHHGGREARAAVDAARAQVAQAIGAGEGEIVFTSGGTEADNLAVAGALARLEPGRLLISAVEHAAVAETAKALAHAGWAVDVAPVDGEGVVDAEAFARALRPDTRLASVMLANNVVGSLQPVRELARLARDNGTLFHTDAVQAVGAMPVDVRELDVDLLALSAHKFHGPKGVGALFVRRGVRVAPLVHGGGHERRLRSGTENVPGIVGMATALELASAELPATRPRVAALRDRLVRGVLDGVPEVRLLGHPRQRLPGNACFAVRAVEGESLVLRLDDAGFMCASGSACASSSLEPSHVLLAMGLDAEAAHGSLRVSLGRGTTEAEVEAFVQAFPRVVEGLRAMSPLWPG